MPQDLSLAFVGSEVTREQLIASLEAHHAADRIVQGLFYWNDDGCGDGRGCAVGCSIHDFRPGEESRHALYGNLFGVPEALARLEDRIFVGLAPEEAREWPLRFARAIQTGADLSRVEPAVLFRIIERRRGLLPTSLRQQARQRVEAAMTGVLSVLAEWRDTGERPVERASAAYAAAASAASTAFAYNIFAAANAAASAAASAHAPSAHAASADTATYAANAAAYTAAAVYTTSTYTARAAARRNEWSWIAGVLEEELTRAPRRACGVQSANDSEKG